jgi:hypothetical protein
MIVYIKKGSRLIKIEMNFFFKGVELLFKMINKIKFFLFINGFYLLFNGFYCRFL